MVIIRIVNYSTVSLRLSDHLNLPYRKDSGVASYTELQRSSRRSKRNTPTNASPPFFCQNTMCFPSAAQRLALEKTKSPSHALRAWPT